jgi:hypothetical protein
MLATYRINLRFVVRYRYYITIIYLQIVLVEDPLLDRPLLGAFIVPNAPVQVNCTIGSKLSIIFTQNCDEKI